jgi:hypothetical protein
MGTNANVGAIMSNHQQDGFNIFDSKEIQDNFTNNGMKVRKAQLDKLVQQAGMPTLQLKVLSSAHLEKDFTLLINPKGILPQQQNNNFDGQLLVGYENGPRRQDFDGFTYFGVEDGTKGDDDDES